MVPQENYNSNLGDIARIFDSKDVVDLDWLDVTPGENYDNIPSESSREVIPQLQAQWNKEQYSSPFRLIPNTVAPDGSAGKSEVIGEDDLFDVARVAKKAMMQGIKGPDMVNHLRARFSSEMLSAATEELKKVASEEGLLGNVYIDLSPFRNTKEAAVQLGQHRIRLASFVVGSPYLEKDFVDSFGRCRNLNKIAVDKVEYTQEVLSHYSTHLKNAGLLDKAATLNSKDELREAFLNAKAAEIVEEEKTAPVVDDSNYKSAMAVMMQASIEKDKKLASDIRTSRARPVLAKVQDLMLRGAIGDDLRNGISSCLDTSTINEFAPEIKGLVRKQGLIGPLLVDISTYNNVESAAGAISQAFMKPKFLHSSMPVEDGFMEKVQTRTGIPILTGPSDITAEMAEGIISYLRDAGKLENEQAHDLILSCKEASSSPADVIKNAMFVTAAKKDSKEVKMANTQQGYLRSSVSSDKVSFDRGAIKTAATQAFGLGLSASDVETKVASYVPIGEAIGIVREAMASMDEISADSLDKCQTQSYPMAKKACIVATSKCSSCVRSIQGTCTKQGRSFKRVNVRKASQVAPTIDPAIEMGMSSNALHIDMASVITPPRKRDSFEIGKVTLGNIPL